MYGETLPFSIGGGGGGGGGLGRLWAGILFWLRDGLHELKSVVLTKNPVR